MRSIRSSLFILMLRYRNLLLLQWKRKPMVSWDTSIPELRAKVNKGSGLFGKLPADFQVTPVDQDNFCAEWLLPGQAKEGKAILYLHGGGYVLGSAKGHRPIVAKFVKATNVPALVVDYRLAPEHPFPAALNDALAGYRYLLQQGYLPEDIVIMGDSAGGGLALALLLAIKKEGLQQPAAAVALSPWTDLLNTGESLLTNEKVDPLTWRESQAVFSAYYAAGQDAANPLISPLYGELEGLPPLLLTVGGDELLLDDSTRFAQRANAADVDVDLIVMPGMFHCYPVCAPVFPEATQSMQKIVAFIEKRIGV